MIKFCYLTCCKSDLVSVRTESLSGFTTNFYLWKFSFVRFTERNCWVSGSSYAHWLINPWTAWKWVADCSTDTSCRTSERFDFCRVVVSFVFKHQKPCFFFVARLSGIIVRVVNIDVNWTGVVFFAYFKIVEFSVFFEIFDSDYGHVHEADWFIFSVCVNFCSHRFVIFEWFFEQFWIRSVLNFYVCEFC